MDIEIIFSADWFTVLAVAAIAALLYLYATTRKD